MASDDQIKVGLAVRTKYIDGQYHSGFPRDMVADIIDAANAPLLEVVRVAYDTLQTIHYANAGDSPQTTEMARLASEALRPFLPESEGKDA